MEIAIFEQAKKLQEQIKQCERVLSNDIEFFVGREWLTSSYANYSIPKELNNQILELVKQYLENCKRELKEL